MLVWLCCCKKNRPARQPAPAWRPDLPPKRSTLRRNSVFFDESNKEQVGKKPSVSFELNGEPPAVPWRDSRSAKIEYIRRQSIDEDEAIYAQPCDSIDGTTMGNAVNNKLYDKQRRRASDGKVEYVEVVVEGGVRKLVGEKGCEDKTSELELWWDEWSLDIDDCSFFTVYAAIDLLKTVGQD
jgi:hypothetical protein